MSKYLPFLKIQCSRGRDFSDLFHRLFEAGGEDVEDIRLAFARGLKRVYVFIEGRPRGWCKRVLGGFGLGLGSSDLMGARNSRRGG